MNSRIGLLDQLGLAPKYANFVVEYVKDFSARRAAQASGFEADSGYGIIKRDDVSRAIDYIITQRLEANLIDADWLLTEMVDNHLIARQTGNLNASNAALSLVAKHKRVDAFAADKIKVSTDADVVDRLVLARKRLSDIKIQDDDDISFL